jgi:hypothetical protein
MQPPMRLPTRRPYPPADNFINVPFPVLGEDLTMGYNEQRAQTTPLAQNVRSYEPSTERNRGGSRPGLYKWIATQVNGANLIQDLNQMAISQAVVPRSVALTTTPSQYILLATAISNGKFRFAVSGDASPQWYLPTTDSTFWVTGTNVVRSAVLNQKLWVADGTNWFYWDPSTAPTTGGTVTAWAASSGTLPANGSNTPRLIAAWRGRMVLASVLGNVNEIYMSAIGDPTNFNYAPASTTPTQAVLLSTSNLGLLSDPVTALIPYTDDVLIVGTQTSLWMIQGDPMAGGYLQVISRSIGVAFGQAWCMDPYGNIYFLANRGGIYQLNPTQGQPQRISQQVEQIVNDFSVALVNVRLIWDDRAQGLHIYDTVSAGAALTNHLFWDQRNNAWWVDQFANNNLNPIACTVMEGYTTLDRLPLLGSWDGYVRSINHTATTDDGTAIISSVFLGPILSKDFDDIMLMDLQCLLGVGSGNVTYSVMVGSTAEAALNTPAVASGTWNPSRNLSNLIRRAGHAIWIEITSSSPWSFEALRARVRGEGRVRQRGH